MGLFKRKNKQEIRADTDEAAILTFFGASDTVSREQALEIPTVSACINKIAETVSQLPVKLYRKEDGKVREITDDVRLPLLNGETGDTLSTADMWKAAVSDYYLGRGAWIYINSSGLDVRSIHYVDGRNVSIQSNTDPIFKAFRVRVNGRSYYDFQFIKLLRKTTDGWTNIPLQNESQAILSAAYNSLKLENMMSANGGCKPGVLKAKTKLSAAAIESVKQNYRQVYDNSGKREKMLVLNDGLDFEPISSTAAELQMNENKRANSVEICKLFGFPHTIIDGGASEEDNKLFIAAVIALLNQIETELDRSLLLETEKAQGYYWAFDTKELTRGSVLERYQAYEIAARNRFLQIDEIRQAEDYDPLGFNFVTLGLGDVLLNTETMEVFTPNTGQTSRLLEGEERADDVELRWGDSWIYQERDGNGRWGASRLGGWGAGGGRRLYHHDPSIGGGGGGKSAKGVDKSEKSDIIKPEDVSATGKNELKVKGFPNKQKLNNHWQNGRTHADEYKPDGITTKEQYEKRGVELAESAADGKKILGYKTKEGFICRYDVKKNDYVKANVNKGLITLFKPREGVEYYKRFEKAEGVKK